MKARWLTLLAAVPLLVGMALLESCGGVGGPTGPSPSGANAPTAAFLGLMGAEQKGSAYIGPEACAAATCHGGASISAHVKATMAALPRTTTPSGEYATWKLTAHAQNGVTCENCHGPGGAHQKNPTSANILTFPQVADPVVCAQCHGPIASDYSVSAHAQLITDPVSPGTQSSRCMLCHSGLTRPEYTEQGIDFAAVTVAQATQTVNDTLNVEPHVALCATCHDPHAKTGNLDQNGNEVQIRHPESSTDTTDLAGGTSSLAYTAINQICAECHNGRGTNPADSALLTATRAPHPAVQFNTLMGVGGVEDNITPPQRVGTHASAVGQCVHCHMPNSRHTFTVSLDTGCAPCHTAADAAARETALQAEITDDLTSLQTRMSAWAQTTFGNSTYWDYPANISSGTPPSQTLVPIQVKHARYNYYFVVNSGDLGVHNPGYTRFLMQIAANDLTTAGLSNVPASAIASIPESVKLAQIKANRALAMRASGGHT